MKTKLPSTFSLQPSAFAFLAALTLLITPPRAPAQTLTNPIGPATGLSSALASDQLLAARFAFSTPVTVVSVGGEFKNLSGTFFAALVPLSSMSALPIGDPGQGIPFNPGEVLAYRTFSASVGSTPQIVTVPFNTNLPAGVYGVVFGTGLYETSGQGEMPRYNDVPGSSGFFWSSDPWRWQDSWGANDQHKIMITTPFLVTLPAGVWASTAATLNGRVNPGGLDTTAWFEWGTNTTYGNKTSVTNLGSGTNWVLLSVDLTGLTAGSNYHYRVAATNSNGLATGSNVAFTTPTSFFIKTNTGLSPRLNVSSVAWGDYNNDGRLDILLTGRSNSVLISQVWSNKGDGTFTNINAGLPGVYTSSAAWGDYDNDGRLDILLTGDTLSGYIAQVWRNRDTGFSKTFDLPGVAHSSVAWGDYNNDGRLDILLTGHSSTGGIAQVWRNNGNGTFTDINAGLPGVDSSSVAWGDYNNDGRLDILLTGYAGPNWLAQVWRNNGDGTFTDINVGLPVGGGCSVAWGDYDNDGRLDILLTGWDVNSIPIAQVWRNTGTTFTNINVGLTGVGSSSVAWGDYDNDGRLDILLTGRTASDALIAQVLRSNGDATFTDINAGLPGVNGASIAWGDYDNDGRLDILLTGFTNTVPGDYSIAQVWRNNGPATNTPPTAPMGLTNSGITLSWNPATDGQTPTNGLTYNLRVGTTSNGFDVVSPQAALGTGFRRLPALGNAQHSLQRSLSVLADLPWGIYYWSVQAVDTAFAGSPFASEARVVVAAKTLPATNVGLTTATLNGMVHPLQRLTGAWFQWGATTNYDHTTMVTNLGSGNSALPVSCVLTGLTLHTYHYRVEASNDLGLHVGLDSFIAMQLERPQVVALQATNVTSTSMTLQGEVNPRERDTLAWFEYGLTTKYSTVTAATNVGRGPDNMPVSFDALGLMPWMSYHYRTVASNSVGRTDGADMTFTLPGPSLSAPALSAPPDVTLPQGGSTSVWFSVSDLDTPLDQLNVQARCNNPVLMPGASLVLGGSGSARSLTLAPDSNHSGSAVVTLSVSDDAATTCGSFTVSVTPPAEYHSPLLYLTNAASGATQTWYFRLVDAGTGSTNYAVEYRSDLSPTNGWVLATNVTDLGGGLYEVDIGPPQPDTGFYRVKGFRMLTAGLGSAGGTVDEGASQMGAVIVFNGAFVGTVSYTWTGSWGTTNGTVQVNGTTAVIPIPVADNTGIDQLRSLTLRLEAGPGFALGGTTQSTITVEENDADWQGTLVIPNGLADTTTAWLTNRSGGYTNVALPQNANTVIGFTLQMLQSNGTLQGQIQSDGYGFFPTNALAQLTRTENRFTAVATNVPLPALTGSPLFSAPHHLDLRLDAANASGQTNVSLTQISGVATLVSVVPGRPYLDSALSGTFLLLKPPVIPSTNQVPLYPAP